MKWAAILALAEAAFAFAVKYHWLLSPALVLSLAVASVYLPTAQFRVYPVAALTLVGPALGFFGAKALDGTPP